MSEECKNCTRGCLISNEAYNYDEDEDKIIKLPGWWHFNPTAEEDECMSEICDTCDCDKPERIVNNK